MPAKFKSREHMIEEFWRSVKTGLPDECWQWLWAKDRKGYGRLSRVTYGVTLAHRFAYEVTHGPIPEGLFVCHKCDNPSCVNPNHLWLGTNMENTRDSLSKGRGHLRAHPVYGDANSLAKLTNAEVIDIRKQYAAGVSQTVMAERYGVRRQTIWKVVHRESWTHLPESQK